MRIKLTAVAIVIAFGAPLAALAQAPDAPPAASPPASAPSAHSVELAKRFFVVAHVDAQIDTLLANLVPALIQSETKRVPNASPELAAAITQATLSAAHEWAPKVMDRMAVEYAKVFTDKELEGAIAFYDSPVGRSLIAKSPRLAPVATKIVMAMQPELIRMIGDQVCKKVDCSTLPPPAPADAR